MSDVTERLQGVLDNTTLYDNATRAITDAIKRIAELEAQVILLAAELEEHLSLFPCSQCFAEWDGEDDLRKSISNARKVFGKDERST